MCGIRTNAHGVVTVHILTEQTLPWLSTQWVLGQLGKCLATCRAQHERFVKDGYGEGHRPEFHSGEADSRVL